VIKEIRFPGKLRALLYLLLLLFLWSIINSSACPGNGPYPYSDSGRIDTTQIRELDQPLSINMQVSVREFDYTNYKFLPVESAAVHYINADTTIFSDSNGYVNTGLIFPTFTGILFPIMLSRR